MKNRVKQLAVENTRQALPDDIWHQVKRKMDDKYKLWSGVNCEYVQGLVARTRAATGMGGKIKTLKDDDKLKNLPNGTPFIHFRGCFPNPEDLTGEMCRFMVFGNQALFFVAAVGVGSFRGRHVFNDPTSFISSTHHNGVLQTDGSLCASCLLPYDSQD
jgi:hypothetical protein